MLRIFLWCGALATIAIALVDAQGLAKAEGTEQHSTEIPGKEAPPRSAEKQPTVSLGQPLLAAIETWLAFQFDLPSTERHPRVELAPPEKIAAFRYHGFTPTPELDSAPDGQSVAPSERDVVAVYSDAAQTIYLADDWTGGTPAELSVLVHEMVHHLQNVGGLKYRCPQEREKLAYAAQERWLGLFGHSLERDFELDPFSVLVKTNCLY